MFAGLGFLLACGLLAVVLGVRGEGPEIAPYIAGAGVLGYFVATLVAAIPQQVTLEIKGSIIRPSWRPEFKREQVVLSSLIAPGVDAAMGLAVEIRGQGGRIRIGGGHDGDGYEITGKPLRSVDCQLPKEAFDDLLAAVGVERGPPGPLVVPLIRSTQSFVGIVGKMAPWLVTVTLLGVFGIILGNTGWGERLIRSEDGQIVILVVCGALAVAGVGAMIVRSRRIRRPEFELRFDGDALIVVDARHNSSVRVPWKDVTIEKLAYSVSSRYGAFSMPLLVIGTPERKLRLGAWDTGLAWPDDPPKTWRAPHWLVGAAKWPKLVDVLRRHNRV